MILILLFVLFIVTGFLAAWTGAGGQKFLRRYIIPVILTVIGLFIIKRFDILLLMAYCIPLSLGYGIPDPPDKGSMIGKFWYKLLKTDRKAAIATRGTIGIIEAVIISVIPFIYGNAGAWALWAWASTLVIANNILWGDLVDNEGEVKIFGKQLLIEEFLIHGLNSVLIVALMLLK